METPERWWDWWWWGGDGLTPTLAPAPAGRGGGEGGAAGEIQAGGLENKYLLYSYYIVRKIYTPALRILVYF